MIDYSKMTGDQFSDILGDVVFENASTLLSVPGVYEACSEYFNNEVLDRWWNSIGKDLPKDPIDINSIEGARCKHCGNRARLNHETEERLCCIA